MKTLPALIEWREGKKYPFALCTEASINLADDEDFINPLTISGRVMF